MAITRIKQKLKFFEYEGIRIGVRQATVNEMKAIAKLRKGFIESLRAQNREESANPSGYQPEGDASELIALQEFISVVLCCDPTNAQELWFAQSESDAKSCASRGVAKDLSEDVPAEFHAAAYMTFVGMANQFTVNEDGSRVFPDEVAVADEAGDDESRPLSKTTETETPTETTTEVLPTPATEEATT